MIFGVSLWEYYDRLHTVCTGNTCTDWQLTPENLQAIEGLGLSLDFYAAYLVALAIIFVGVCLMLAAVIVWRTQDRMALFVALVLVLFGTTMPQAPQTVAVSHAVLSWLSHSLGFLGFASIALFINLFPSGRFVPRWTRWAALVWIAVAGQSIFFPDSLSNLWFSMLNTLGFMGAAGASLGALVYRYRRRADLIQRQQIKWVVFGIAAALGIALGIALLSLIFPEPLPSSLLSKMLFPSVFTFAFFLIPISIAVAILRYRLWDIDVIINRTLVYGSLTAALALVYISSVVSLQALLRVLTGQDSTLAIVASTLVIAALFNPLRRRVQGFVDRRFYRRKYDARKTLEAFSAKLKDETDLGTLADDLVGVVGETMQPAHVSFWLRLDAPKGEKED